MLFKFYRTAIIENVTGMVCKRCLIGLQKGVNKTSKGHLLEAKRALIRVQLSLNKNRSSEKYLQRGWQLGCDLP